MARLDSETWTASDISSAPIRKLMAIPTPLSPSRKGATTTQAPPATSTAACVVWGITLLLIVCREYEHTCDSCVTPITVPLQEANVARRSGRARLVDRRMRRRAWLAVPSGDGPPPHRHAARRARP